MHCKTTHFDIESLQYCSGRATYKTFPKQATGLIKPVFSALAWLDQKL
jgi:hypothetical protein